MPETPPIDYAATDHSGHYLLLIDPSLQQIQNEEEIDTLRNYVATPLGGYRPVPQARRFHQSAAQYRFCLGGNRSSKSHAAAHELAMLVLNLHPFRRMPNPVNAWYATQTYEMVGAILWDKLEKLFVNYDYEITWISKGENIPRSVRVRRSDGETSRISFKAYNQGRETFQGTDMDVVAFDEQCPQDVYTEAISRIGSEKKLLFFASFTPIIPQPWLEEKLSGALVNTEVFEFPLDDNRVSRGGFIDDQEIDALIAEWPEEIAPTRRQGKWGSYIGTIFQTFNRSIHVVKEAEEFRFLLGGDGEQRHFPISTTCVGAIDWGGANPFVFLWGVQLPHLDGAWYIFDEIYWDSRKRGMRRLEDHANEIKSRTKDRWKTELRIVWADHDPTDAYEMQGHGVPSYPANKDVTASIEYIQTLLKVRADTRRPRLYIAERCKNLAREISTYHWSEVPIQGKKDAKNEPAKKDDHTVDAMRYMTLSERDNAPIHESKHVSTEGAGRARQF